MMTRSPVNERTFKRAMVYSAVFHAVLFTLIALSPSLPQAREEGHGPLRQLRRVPRRGRTAREAAAADGQAGRPGARRRRRPSGT